MLGRFTQDAVENLFSAIRMKNTVPDCKEFKRNLRFIILSQFFYAGVKGNYDADESIENDNIMSVFDEFKSEKGKKKKIEEENVSEKKNCFRHKF